MKFRYRYPTLNYVLYELVLYGGGAGIAVAILIIGVLFLNILQYLSVPVN